MEVFNKNGEPLSIIEVLGMASKIDLPGVTRVEVIDDNGRSYVNWKPNNNSFLMLQDEGRTLKVCIRTQP